MTNPSPMFVPVKTDDLDWVPDGNGFHTKVLHRASDEGRETLLMKLDPGAFFPVHHHDYFEQMYVVEGSFYDQENTYQAGDFVTREAGAEHLAGSKSGAIVLVWQSR